MKIRMVGSAVALLAGLLVVAPSATRAEGRITVTKATVQGCRAMGKCIWKVTCQVGKEQLVQDLRGVSRDVKEIAKSYDAPGFPVNVQCKTEIDDGFFTTSWKEVGKAVVPVPGGGDWDLEMANKENGGVIIHVTVDSLEVGAPAAAPAAPAAPGKAAKAPAKAPAKAAAASPRQYIGVFQASQQGEAVLVGFSWDQFKARADQLDAGGSRIVALDTYMDGGRRLWSGIFRSGTEKQALFTGLDFPAFTKQYKNMVNEQHMRLVDIVVYDEGQKRLLAGAYREGYDKYDLWVGQEQAAFQGKVTEPRWPRAAPRSHGRLPDDRQQAQLCRRLPGGLGELRPVDRSRQGHLPRQMEEGERQRHAAQRGQDLLRGEEAALRRVDRRRRSQDPGRPGDGLERLRREVEGELRQGLPPGRAGDVSGLTG